MARVIVLFVLSMTVAGCGKEGPFGNTPGPKKPIWSDSFMRTN